MRAAFIRTWGPPLDVVEVGEFDEPVVGPDAVLVEVVAASVNPVDWKVVEGGLQGAYPHHLPLIPGWDVAGVVAEIGPAVTSVAVGDRVAAYARKDHVQLGTFAQRVAVPERAVARVPAGLALERAATLPLSGLTAQQLLDTARLGPGDTVLVHGATGGVGTFAVQLAKLRGATVIGTGSPAGHDRLVARGVAPVDYHADLVAQVRSHVPAGVDVVIDLAGGDALVATPELLADGGRLASAIDPVLTAQLLLLHGYRGHYVFVRPDAAMLSGLLSLMAEGQLDVDIAETHELDDAAAALEANRSGRVRGKVVVRVADVEQVLS